MPKKVLVAGKGGREHALARQFDISGYEVIAAPGNPGIEQFAKCWPVDMDDHYAIADLAEAQFADLVVPGPEVPLTNGLIDELERRGIPGFGPNKAAARLEASKAHMKRAAHHAGVPTAQYGVFQKGQERAAAEYYASLQNGGVVKTDGLAEGKGVTIPTSRREAIRAIEYYLSGRAFGEAGETIVIEEKLEGREVSLFVLCDGRKGIPLGVARDYKRLKDGGEGPNTGGMGSYSPVGDVSPELINQLMEAGVDPMLDYLNKEDTPYRGVLYVGFMLTEQGPMVLEYNIRFGDPEAQVIVPRLTSDLYTHCMESLEGGLTTEVTSNGESAVTVTLASPGYPEDPALGGSIEGMAVAEAMDDVLVFHAGTKRLGRELVTNGGRVLNVTGLGKNQTEARNRAYEAADTIEWPGLQKRGDIAEA